MSLIADTIRLDQLDNLACILFTLFIQIKAHPGEFFNKKADRWADKGRETAGKALWKDLSLRPIFTWEGHPSSMNTMVKAQNNLIVARLQVLNHSNFITAFL